MNKINSAILNIIFCFFVDSLRQVSIFLPAPLLLFSENFQSTLLVKNYGFFLQVVDDIALSARLGSMRFFSGFFTSGSGDPASASEVQEFRTLSLRHLPLSYGLFTVLSILLTLLNSKNCFSNSLSFFPLPISIRMSSDVYGYGVKLVAAWKIVTY